MMIHSYVSLSFSKDSDQASLYVPRAVSRSVSWATPQFHLRLVECKRKRRVTPRLTD